MADDPRSVDRSDLAHYDHETFDGGDLPYDPMDLLEEWFLWWRDSDEAPPKLPKALHVRTGLELLLAGRIEGDFDTLP